jgi:hypothetical protein
MVRALPPVHNAFAGSNGYFLGSCGETDAAPAPVKPVNRLKSWHAVLARHMLTELMKVKTCMAMAPRSGKDVAFFQKDGDE